MIMYLIPLAWMILILANIKLLKTPRYTGFTKDQSLALRGISAIEIMLGHIAMYGDTAALFVFRKSGILFVGIFFALSGYGLAYSVSKKSGYLDGFLPRKILALLVPAFVAYIIGLLGLSVQYSYRVFDELARPWEFPRSVNWFIWELLALYVITYICVKIAPLKKTHFIVLICSFIFVGAAFVVRLDNPWYGSTFCFWLGLVYYEYRDTLLKKWIEEKVILHTLIVFIIFGLSVAAFIKLGDDSILGNVIGRNIASTSFVMILMLVLPYVQVENKVSKWLGTISFEIYLLHVAVVTLCQYLVKDLFFSSIVSILITVCLAYVFRYVSSLIKRFISKIINNNKGEKK